MKVSVVRQKKLLYTGARMFWSENLPQSRQGLPVTPFSSQAPPAQGSATDPTQIRPNLQPANLHPTGSHRPDADAEE